MLGFLVGGPILLWMGFRLQMTFFGSTLQISGESEAQKLLAKAERKKKKEAKRAARKERRQKKKAEKLGKAKSKEAAKATDTKTPKEVKSLKEPRLSKERKESDKDVNARRMMRRKSESVIRRKTSNPDSNTEGERPDVKIARKKEPKLERRMSRDLLLRKSSYLILLKN